MTVTFGRYDTCTHVGAVCAQRKALLNKVKRGETKRSKVEVVADMKNDRVTCPSVSLPAPFAVIIGTAGRSGKLQGTPKLATRSKNICFPVSPCNVQFRSFRLTRELAAASPRSFVPRARSSLRANNTRDPNVACISKTRDALDKCAWSSRSCCQFDRSPL